MATTPARETHAETMARLKAEHRATVEQIRAERATALAKIQHDGDARKAAWDLKEAQRLEIQREQQQTLDAITLASRQHIRDYRQYLGVHLTVTQRQEALDELIESEGLFTDTPDVVLLREGFYTVCRQEQVTVLDIMHPAIRQGRAFSSLREVVIPPIRSRKTGAIAWHELAHVVGPQPPDSAPLTKTETGSFRVAGEPLAWRWVQRHTPVWTVEMHAFAGVCLKTYLPHATPTEAADIADACSRLTFRQVQLRLLTQGATYEM